MSKSTGFTALHLLTILGAICCLTQYANAQFCQECKDVPGCDCNCKEIRCMALFKDNALQDCWWNTVKRCLPPDVPLYVSGGDNLTCVESNDRTTVYNALKCSQLCAGCGKSGRFE